MGIVNRVRPDTIAASDVLCRFCCYRLRKARPRRADDIRGWSDCGEASAKVSVAAKTTSLRVPNRTNGSRTRPPSELELAIFTSRFVDTLHLIHVVLFIRLLFIFFFFSIWDAWKCTSRVVCLFAKKHSKCLG